jgi:diguanylate cyclase (GGDEF)-like protein/PAS domain S-box-containing protein
VNVAFSRITGYAEEEVIGQCPSILKSGRQDPAFYTRMWQSLKTMGHWEGEIWNRRKSGEVYAELLSISAVHDAHNKVQNYVGLFTDISSQKAHEQELEHIARYDVLTALPNRALLADRLQQEMAHCLRQRKQLAVVFIDLDGFKQVNDQHGHNIGDEVLIGLAQRMKAALREGDTLSRIGGDEFVAVLTALDHPRDCELVLTRLLEAAAQTMVINGADIQVSASLGVTLFPQDAGEPDLLMRHADHAMYQAKQAGKNRYHYFDVKDDTDVKTHRETIHQIQSALERGEFVLHYQPKVNLKSGAVMGMEALIRWQHPVRGLLAPGEFLPAIEGHPISLLVGEWVLRTALAQMDQWRQSGLDLPVSVNVGGLQLLHPHFVAILLELLALYPGVAPQNLELEILETSALHDIEEVSRVMHACSKLGVRFALDDFGTGYSSLTYLKRLPAQTLKIDQSFVRDMLGDPDDAAIVEGIIGLTVAFRRSVIAEGVETMGHGAMLLSLGCFQAQGYGVARPMPAQEVAPWIHAWASGERWKALQTLPTIAQAH